MAATREAAVATADSFMGVVEAPPHSNHTIVGERYGWNGVAWCCEFVSLVLMIIFGHWLNKTAGVADFVARADRGENGFKSLPKDAQLQVGDCVCFDWGGKGNPMQMHIEICRNPDIQSHFQDIGGNVNDAVAQPWRDRTFVFRIVRPPYVGSPALPPPPPPVVDVRRRDALHHGTQLGPDSPLTSNSGLYKLILQGDGNLVLYRAGKAVWDTKTNGKPSRFLAMQDDDNLVLYGPGNTVIWKTNTEHMAGRLHSHLIIQDDGNLVIYDDANKPLWDRFRGKLR